MFLRSLSLVAVALVLAMLPVQCLANEADSNFSVRTNFFNPKSARSEWLNVFDVAGKSLSCSEHPNHPGVASYFRGAYIEEQGLALEYDLRLECQYSGMPSILQEGQAYQLFLGDSSEGSVEFQRLGQDEGLSAPPIPEGYERVHFTLCITAERAKQLRAIILR